MKFKIAFVLALGMTSRVVAQSVVFSATDTSSSGNNHYGVEITPTINQTGSAGFTDIFINRTETAIGSGSQDFQDFEVGGVDKWIVDHTGTVTLGTWSGSPIGLAFGGTGQTSASAAFNALSPMTTVGDLIYGGASGTGTRLAGSISTSKQFLTQTGSGTASAAPTWGTIAGSDLPNPSSTTLGGVQSLAATAHEWINTISTSGVPAATQPTSNDILGTTTNDNAPAGYIGEYAYSQVLVANAISISTSSPLTVTSISLTAGDWDVWGAVVFLPAATTTMTDITASITNTNNGGLSTDGDIQSIGTTFTTGRKTTLGAPVTRVSISTTTTYYIIAYVEFTGGSESVSGWIAARRVR